MATVDISTTTYGPTTGSYALHGLSQPLAAYYATYSGVLNNIDPIGMSLQAVVRLQVNGPEQSFTDQVRLVQTLAVQISQDYPEPVVVDGVPTVPAYLASFPWQMTAEEGPGAIYVVGDPAPIWNGVEWEYPVPLPSGPGDYTWQPSALPDPSAPNVTSLSQLTGASTLVEGGTYYWAISAFGYQTITEQSVSSHTDETKALEANGGNATTIAAANTIVKLSWTAIPNATGYAIYAAAGAPSGWQLIGWTTGTSFTDNGARPYPGVGLPTANTADALDGSYPLITWEMTTATIEVPGPEWEQVLAEYRPLVRPYTYLGPRGQKVFYPVTVQFASENSQFMTTNLIGQEPPFTWILVAILRLNADTQVDYLLDCGTANVPANVGSSTQNVPDDALGYRAALQASGTLLTGASSSDPTTQLACPTLANDKTAMYFGVFNGADSMVGSWGPAGSYQKSGNIPNLGQCPYMMIGRRQGLIGRQFGTDMVLLEVRWFQRALSETELDEQYAQLSSTYQFAAFQ